MSGYLQRLTASVIKPGAAIHPIVGSVFSAPTRVAPADHEELIAPRSAATETVRSAPAVQMPRSLEPDTPVASDAPEGTVLAREGFRGLVEPPQRQNEVPPPDSSPIVTQEHFRSVRNERPEPVLEPSRPTIEHHPSVPPETSQPKRQRSAEPEVEASEPSFAATHQATRPETAVYRPLIEESLVRQTAPTILQEKIREARSAEKRESPRRQAARRHEPDEIQIHIGRIEVVAAPPAPVRAEPRPVRPSPNLGEYLKRRHGRA